MLVSEQELRKMYNTESENSKRTPLKAVDASVHAENTASANLLLKCGFRKTSKGTIGKFQVHNFTFEF